MNGHTGATEQHDELTARPNLKPSVTPSLPGIDSWIACELLQHGLPRLLLGLDEGQEPRRR
jgi:hypothetical protein